MRNVCFNGVSHKLNSHNSNHKLRILHITNFAERQDGRLYFVSIGHKLSSGFVKLGHSVLNFSDRDMIKMRRFYNLNSKSTLNNKIFTTVQNYNPDLIAFANNISIIEETITEKKIENIIMGIALYNQSPEDVIKKINYSYNAGFSGISLFSYNVLDEKFHKMEIDLLEGLF